MYGILPLDEYVANYDALLESKPFKYGNMRGRVLNKSKFFNEHSDYEVLLRNDIPEKYTKYFECPTSILVDDVEVGRSAVKSHGIRSTNINLSPRKHQPEVGYKTSEVLHRHSGASPDEDLKSFNWNDENYALFDNYSKKSTDKSHSLDLGDLKLSSTSKANAKPATKDAKPQFKNKGPEPLLRTRQTVIDVDDIDHLCDQTFQRLNKTSLIDEEGEKLNVMIKTLTGKLKEAHAENSILRSNIDNSKIIIEDLNGLVVNYKQKLKAYYSENKMLKRKIHEQEQSNDLSTYKYAGHDSYNESSNVKTSNTNRMPSTLDSLDEQIKMLHIRRRELADAEKRSTTNSSQLNAEELSENIVKHLFEQLKAHNHHSESIKHETEDAHECPFCDQQKAQNIFDDLKLSSAGNLSQSQMIEIIADRIQEKLSGKEKAKPDVW